ncbi:hypothetical protein [uncultured Brevibacillus sp.]|uniref:hypothetical protein n=1 Tax=uncultured Brevibacillus sp. TaxID=169970 RepID=UPI002595915D|nr:hypothetical protein [uncultured Brevibacillus sp.]
MGLESYNLKLFPHGNQVLLTEIGWEVKGEIYIPFSNIISFLFSLENVISYTPLELSKSEDAQCYYCYSDYNSIIEIEINYGDYEEYIQEISIRFAVCNPKGTYENAMMLCKLLSDHLKLEVLDMRLEQVLDFTDELQMAKSKKTFEEKKDHFFSTFDLPYEVISQPIHCGKAFWEVLKKGNK